MDSQNNIVQGRDVSIDLLKVILMLLVVFGHIINVGHIESLNNIYQIIYWFHMPAFFLITGYLTNLQKESFKSFTSRKFFTYIVPYISFCLLFFLIFRPGIKGYLIKIVYGGSLHVGFTGPFWYICCLFVTLVFFKYLSERMKLPYIVMFVLLMWFVAHYTNNLLTYSTPSSVYNILKRDEFPLPFGISNLFVSSMFFLLGNCSRSLVSIKKMNITPPILAMILSAYIIENDFFYKFDMKYVIANDAYMDIVIPSVFTLSFYYLSIIIATIIPQKGKEIIVKLSKSGLICIFIHMALLQIITLNLRIFFNEWNIYIFTIFVYIVSFFVYELCNRCSILAFLFIGARNQSIDNKVVNT